MNKIFGILITIVLLFLLNPIFTRCNNQKNKEKRNAKELALIEIWGKNTVDFFNTMNTDKLVYRNYQYRINKFIIVSAKNLQLNETNDTEIFKNHPALKKYHTKNINDANVIIWLKPVINNNNIQATYSDGSKAIRMQVDVCLVNKSDMTVFRNVLLDCIGEPLKSVERRQGSAPRNYYFGKYPYDTIGEIILESTN